MNQSPNGTRQPSPLGATHAPVSLTTTAGMLTQFKTERQSALVRYEGNTIHEVFTLLRSLPLLFRTIYMEQVGITTPTFYRWVRANNIEISTSTGPKASKANREMALKVLTEIQLLIQAELEKIAQNPTLPIEKNNKR